MSKVTKKLQVTIPKALAARLNIRPGDEIEWALVGDRLQLVPAAARAPSLSLEARLALFDAATKRHDAWQATLPKLPHPPKSRGWTRSDLYEPPRGLPR